MGQTERGVALLLLVVGGTTAVAQTASDGSIPVGRYSSVPAEPSAEQSNPLVATVAMRFPKGHIKTVGDAMDYVLKQSGYRLAGVQASDPAMRILLSRPLPEVQRHLGPCSLQHALTTLAGPVYRLVLDPLHRLVSFEVTERYDALARSTVPLRHVAASVSTGSREKAQFTLSGSVYGPTRANDTLLPIALTFRRDRRATPEQMMLAVWQANLVAFGTAGRIPNLNFLKVGVMLTAPAANAWQHWTPAQAKQEINRQHRLWVAYRQSRQARQGGRHGRL